MIDKHLWQGRIDDEDGELGLRFHQKVQSIEEAETTGVMLIGYACDEGVMRNKGRIGAKNAPSAIRKMLANLPWHHNNLNLFDAGDISCHDNNLAHAQERLAALVQNALVNHHFPVVLGGGHDVAWGSFQGLANHYAKGEIRTPPRIGIINFDAHFDLRTPSGSSLNGSSGTPFSQIAEYCQTHAWPFHYACIGVSRASNTHALFNKAETLNVLTIEDIACQPDHFSEISETLAAFMADLDALYLTIDLDVFPASIAPGVSAPATHGVDYALVERLIRLICNASDEHGNRKLKLADIAELNPLFDIDNHTARLAARLVWTITRSLSEPPRHIAKGVMR
ncbi:formimidoylglutamase [Enterovibrio baiacu]|uniref:formimidoylglutamase n=1 Tax=Enterovibrio baiacu TaxID=2491023 RepID=UPI001012F4D1|nr:formimidoylglutamase [Enterovibrio baiacu]MBE1274485.1 formimidoylglutamase [Enterovibrio baiacu]